MISIYLKISISFTFLLFCLQATFAQHYDDSMCANFENYQKAFVGTYLGPNKTIDNKEASPNAKFSIDRAIKGIYQSKDETLTVWDFTKKRLIVGEKYLVLIATNSTREIREFAVTFPITLLFDKSNKSSNENLRIFFGEISVANLEDLKIFEPMILRDGKKFKPKFVPGGIFTIVYQSGVEADVTIQIPPEMDIYIPDGNTAKTVIQNGKTIVKYPLPNTNCICDYKEFIYQEK